MEAVYSEFALRQLQKFGWREGQGVGRTGTGRTAPVRVRLKFDSAGLGFDPAARHTSSWWDDVFAAALQRVGTVGVKEEKETAPPPAPASALYRRFSRGATLVGMTSLLDERPVEETEGRREEALSFSEERRKKRKRKQREAPPPDEAAAKRRRRRNEERLKGIEKTVSPSREDEEEGKRKNQERHEDTSPSVDEAGPPRRRKKRRRKEGKEEATEAPSCEDEERLRGADVSVDEEALPKRRRKKKPGETASLLSKVKEEKRKRKERKADGESASSEDDEEERKKGKKALKDDAALFRLCGGLTAHPAGRHGPRRSAKLARVAAQDAALLRRMQEHEEDKRREDWNSYPS